MTRDLSGLRSNSFDVLIIGGGITGACLAFDAALRGMSTALVEKGDFGGATSASSSKLLHGGLRYLQQLRFSKVRESALERILFQNLAPHLTRYVPFVVPTYRGVAKGRALLAAGMLAYRTLCIGQGRRLRDPSKRIPAGRSLTREELIGTVPGLLRRDLTGGRLFHESHMHSSERMTLSFIDAAARRGARVANYLRAERFLFGGDRVVGIEALDVAGGERLEIRARLVLNAAGPWIRELNGEIPGRRLSRIVAAYSKGAHIVTPPLTGEFAVALPTRRKSRAVVDRGGRHIFVIPWRGCSLVGTTYGPYDGDLDAVAPTSEEIEDLVGEINAGLGDGTLAPAEVRTAFAGIYPLTATGAESDVYQVSGDYQILDHGRVDGVEGLLSVFGAKYTTARLLAERALDRVAGRLGGGFGPCLTRREPTAAGDIDNLEEFRASKLRKLGPDLGEEVVDHLVTCYGRAIDALVELTRCRPELSRRLTADQPVLAAEAVHSAREEMAVHLEDFVFRRTGLGTLGNPGRPAIEAAAEVMGGELGWDEPTRKREVDATLERFPL